MPKMKAGRYMIPVEMYEEDDRIFFDFSFNRDLMGEIKAMDGAKFHGYDEFNPKKIWSVKKNERNLFQIQYLMNPAFKDPNNPYYDYNKPLLEFEPTRKQCYRHQVAMIRHNITRRHCIVAAEMRTGKTLAAIETMEYSGFQDWWYVAPKSALLSVKVEFDFWKSRINPFFMTYEGLKQILANWNPGDKPPRGVIFDESSRCKNPTAQRTQAAMHLANAIRKEWGRDSYIILMSGSPAPKSPVDWWAQAEIACPGFLKEGTIEKLKKRLSIIEYSESVTGGVYPKLLAWKDNPLKCDKCGRPKDEHAFLNVTSDEACEFTPSIDEVGLLYRRLQGLVDIHLKKDCLDLPEKIYRTVKFQPTQSMLNMARLIQARSSSTIEAFTLLRELSDGFQYSSEETGVQTCTTCKGQKVVDTYIDPETDDEFPPSRIEEMLAANEDISKFMKTRPCDYCNATGTIASFSRSVKEVSTPKEEFVLEQLEEHEEVGRLAIYAGFQGSLDKLMRVVGLSGWGVIRVDGRGWYTPNINKSDGSKPTARELYQIFMNISEEYPRVCFLGQPGAAGMGLDLSSSPTFIYYSNDFNAESRIQSEDRGHGPMMNRNLGCTIIDLIHLPTDQIVLDNLKRKRRLQGITLGEIQTALEEPSLRASEMVLE